MYTNQVSKHKAKVTLYFEGTPFNSTEPLAMVYPFFSDQMPERFRNSTLVAEKVTEVRIESGRRFFEALVYFSESEALPYLQAGTRGMYLSAGRAIASVEVL